MSDIGGRVLELIGQLGPGARHRDVAESVGMTPDAFSRAVNGNRQFAAIELARVADYFSVDMHWLVTGTPDPSRMSVAARHAFDHATGRRSIPGRGGDARVLEDVALAYRQAYPLPLETPAPLQDSVEAVRAALGQDFVRPFADRLERNLQVDVVRIAELSTAYSFISGGRRVIAVPATGSWFRENWDMAHELGHLALDHHHDDAVVGYESGQLEADANAFAAQLLLPSAAVRGVDWDGIGDSELASRVWDWGVSIDALSRRLHAILGFVPPSVAGWARHPTQRLLRWHLAFDSELDEITTRMDDAAQRRFPRALQEAHLKHIADGKLGKETLAWMLGIAAAALDVDVPEVPEVSMNDLAAELGL